MRLTIATALHLTALATPALSQEEEVVTISKGEGDQGVMRMNQQAVEDMSSMSDDLQTLLTTGRDQIGSLVFEPYQLRNDLGRADFVYLMRHGPTDWSKRDEQGVAPTDCANQRVMTEEGKTTMTVMGVLMAGSQMRPSTIRVSEWCRDQQTLEALMEGFRMLDADYADSIEVIDDPDANLLLSLEGAPDTAGLSRTISDWEGEDGPLLIISHYTNIEELTEFSVYEGESLILDPTRDNRVRGYFRMQSAAPDPGHFDEAEVSGSTGENGG